MRYDAARYGDEKLNGSMLDRLRALRRLEIDGFANPTFKLILTGTLHYYDEFMNTGRESKY